MFTTSQERSPSTTTVFDFIADLLFMFPGSVYRERPRRSLSALCTMGMQELFSDVVVIQTNHAGEFRYWVHVHLPHGPVCTYRLSSVVCSKAISHHGCPTLHDPEVLLSNFTTEMGKQVGSSLSALFPHANGQPGRQVVTIRNQRDFIFFRFHRYLFSHRSGENAEKVRVRMQELGPRFTLKLISLETGKAQGGGEGWVTERPFTQGKRHFAL